VTAFGSGHDPGVPGSSPASGSLLSGESASPPDPPPSPALYHSLSLSINKFKNLFKKLIKITNLEKCNFDPLLSRHIPTSIIHKTMVTFLGINSLILNVSKNHIETLERGGANSIKL